MQQPAVLPDLSLEARLLSVEAGRASDELCRALDEVQPSVLLALGEAIRYAICLERLGLNLRHFIIPDNADSLIEDPLVDPTGPPSYATTLPLDKMLAAIQATGVPTRLSKDAGRYLCNEALYSALRYAELHSHPDGVGFIHVPHLPFAAADEDYPTLPTGGCGSRSSGSFACTYLNPKRGLTGPLPLLELQPLMKILSI